jgi:hypothetical protein
MAKSKVIAPTAIPQDLQHEIIELAVLKTSLDRTTAAYDRKKERIAGMLLASVEARP